MSARTCPSCGGRKAYYAKTCKGCMDITGPRNPKWRGGQVRVVNGRVAVYMPGHPEAKLLGGKHALRYRVVASEMLGRPLLPGEVVHHINGDPTDDRPENLEVTTQSAHARGHIGERRDPLTGRVLPKAEVACQG